METKSNEFEEVVNVCFMRQVDDIHGSVEWMEAPVLATFFLLAGLAKDFPGERQRIENSRNKTSI